MALLAGPKRKQKLGLDPNNTNWAKDTSAVGQSLLKKMGWKEGAGLGANNDGIVVPVKATMKSDNRGLGCTAQQADAWIAHQEEFDQILAALNSSSSNSGEKETSSNGDSQPTQTPTDDKPKDGAKRFYGRFSRGGVKSLRTTEDLDCIMGRRKSAPKEEVRAMKKKEESNKASCSDDSDSNQGTDVDKVHGVVTIATNCSVQDYFAQKMKSKNLPPCLQKKCEEPEGNSDEKPKINDSYTTRDCTVQEYFAQRMKAKREKLTAKTETSDDCIENQDEARIGADPISNEVPTGGDGTVCGAEEDKTDKKRKKKKKKNKQKDSDNEVSLVAEELEDIPEQATTSRSLKDKKKKMKIKQEDGSCDTTLSVEEQKDISMDQSCEEVIEDKKKTKKRRKEGEELVNVSTVEEVEHKKSKKKKNKGQGELVLVCDSVVKEEENDAIKTDKKKRKKLEKESDEVNENSQEVKLEDNGKKKKGKKRKIEEEESDCVNGKENAGCNGKKRKKSKLNNDVKTEEVDTVDEAQKTRKDRYHDKQQNLCRLKSFSKIDYYAIAKQVEKLNISSRLNVLCARLKKDIRPSVVKKRDFEKLEDESEKLRKLNKVDKSIKQFKESTVEKATAAIEESESELGNKCSSLEELVKTKRESLKELAEQHPDDKSLQTKIKSHQETLAKNTEMAKSILIEAIEKMKETNASILEKFIATLDNIENEMSTDVDEHTTRSKSKKVSGSVFPGAVNVKGYLN